MIMIHSDNKGLVLPPRVAQYQVVIIPIIDKSNHDALVKRVEELEKILKASGIRCTSDTRDSHNAPYKFNYWEQKGVPIRMEIGSKDLAKGEVVLVRRDNFDK